MTLYKPQTDLSQYSICILCPVGGYTVAAKFTKCVANMIAYSWMYGLKVYQMGMTERMVIHWARNDLARIAIDKLNEYDGKPFTHFLWLDDDQTFNPDLAVKLIDHQKDMVSALYYGRTSPHYPVVYVKDTNNDYKHFPIIETPDTLFQCDAVGFGALMMHRKILETMPDPWFKFNECGEDIHFCIEAKKAGFKLFCDGTYKLGHIGVPPVITEKDYQRHVEDNPELFKDKIKVAL